MKTKQTNRRVHLFVQASDRERSKLISALVVSVCAIGIAIAAVVAMIIAVANGAV